MFMKLEICEEKQKSNSLETSISRLFLLVGGTGQISNFLEDLKSLNDWLVLNRGNL
jgi:hypothetical protein